MYCTPHAYLKLYKIFTLSLIQSPRLDNQLSESWTLLVNKSELTFCHSGEKKSRLFLWYANGRESERNQWQFGRRYKWKFLLFFKPRLMKVRKKESKKDLFMFLNRTDGVDNVRNRTIWFHPSLSCTLTMKCAKNRVIQILLLATQYIFMAFFSQWFMSVITGLAPAHTNHLLQSGPI